MKKLYPELMEKIKESEDSIRKFLNSEVAILSDKTGIKKEQIAVHIYPGYIQTDDGGNFVSGFRVKIVPNELHT